MNRVLKFVFILCIASFMSQNTIIAAQQPAVAPVVDVASIQQVPNNGLDANQSTTWLSFLVKSGCDVACEYFKALTEKLSDPRLLLKRAIFVLLVVGAVTSWNTQAFELLWNSPFYLTTLSFLGNNQGSIFFSGLRGLKSLAAFVFKFFGLKKLFKVPGNSDGIKLLNKGLVMVGSTWLVPAVLNKLEKITDFIIDRVFPAKKTASQAVSA